MATGGKSNHREFTERLEILREVYLCFKRRGLSASFRACSLIEICFKFTTHRGVCSVVMVPPKDQLRSAANSWRNASEPPLKNPRRRHFSTTISSETSGLKLQMSPVTRNKRRTNNN
ncbi:unnamed protein product [Heterotrigona itama]|uniref:Uncharacterized protein n=1 Tax=Heterotrigona itama TaxID=395501 RepID=A0A6V7HFX5_9HYME|nr:unnamed protein product [Heterotrigona itama]